jgi:hypothetical protein
MSKIHKGLQLIAMFPEVKSGSAEECNTKLEEAINTEGVEMDNIGRVNTNGIFYCSALSSAIGADGKKYEYMRTILKDPEHRPILSKGVPFEYQDYTRHLLALHIPIYKENGEFDGTLGGAVYLDNFYEKFIENIVLTEGSYLALVDENGDLLYYPDPELIGKNISEKELQEVFSVSDGLISMMDSVARGEEGVGKYEYEGDEKIAYYLPVEVFPRRTWTVIVTSPTKDFRGFISPVVSRLNIQIFFVVGLLVVFMTALMLGLIRWNRTLRNRLVKEPSLYAVKHLILKSSNLLLIMHLII